jgi:hypothetical protein
MTTGPERGSGPVVWRVLRRGKPPLREGGEERQVDPLCPRTTTVRRTLLSKPIRIRGIVNDSHKIVSDRL